MSVKVEATTATAVKEPEVGDLFTNNETGKSYQLTQLLDHRWGLFCLDGGGWMPYEHTLSKLFDSGRFTPFKPGESVKLTQE